MQVGLAVRCPGTRARVLTLPPAHVQTCRCGDSAPWARRGRRSRTCWCASHVRERSHKGSYHFILKQVNLRAALCAERQLGTLPALGGAWNSRQDAP